MPKHISNLCLAKPFWTSQVNQVEFWYHVLCTGTDMRMGLQKGVDGKLFGCLLMLIHTSTWMVNTQCDRDECWLRIWSPITRLIPPWENKYRKICNKHEQKTFWVCISSTSKSRLRASSSLFTKRSVSPFTNTPPFSSCQPRRIEQTHVMISCSSDIVSRKPCSRVVIEYCIAGKFGGDFKLVSRWIMTKLPNKICQ